MKKGAVPTEEQECIAFVKWLRRTNVRFTHFPAGGYRDKVAAMRLKRMGLSKGWPDYFIFYPCLAAVEMKTRSGDNKPTPEQRERMSVLKEAGFVCCTAYGADEAVSFMRGLGVKEVFCDTAISEARAAKNSREVICPEPE